MKTAIITGASSGIGEKTSELFAKEGFAVIINYKKNKDRAEKLCRKLIDAGCQAEVYQADVTDYFSSKQMIDYTVKKYKRIDVLVNNAGIALIKPITDLTDEDCHGVMSVNFKGTFNTCKAAAEYMIAAKKGRIINVTSVWAERGSSCETIYCASKAAVTGFSKALAKELGPSGITVNCVAPGFIDTEMNACLNKSVTDDIVDETPLLRKGTVDDVAQAILFLASDKADFITGQTITVDGGWQV